MPALNLELLKTNIKTQLISKGITKKTYIDGELIDTHEITDEMEQIVEAIATGMQETFSSWQENAIVIVDSTTFIGRII